MRGKKWKNEVDKILIERYPNEKNSILSKELGYGIRTIERHAKMLGLHKSKKFLSETQLKASMEGARWFEYMRITGQKVRTNNSNGKRFEKGRIPDPEIEKKRIAAIRARAWDDRKRIIHGLTPRTKWRYNLKIYEPFLIDDILKED